MMRVCQSIQELLDEELSQMWDSLHTSVLDYGGLNVEATKEENK